MRRLLVNVQLEVLVVDEEAAALLVDREVGAVLLRQHIDVVAVRDLGLDLDDAVVAVVATDRVDVTEVAWNATEIKFLW